MMSPSEILIKLLLGTLLGGVIGFERQTHGRPAGFRTQLLVCVACVLIMIISEGYYARSIMNPEYARIDPTRIAAGAMTGVGFLGAGVILKTGLSVQGLTTAACIWIVSAIGLAVGAGQYFAAIAGFIITFFSLWVLRIFESRMPRLTYKYITVVTDASGDETSLRSVFMENELDIVKVDYEVRIPEHDKTYSFIVSCKEDIMMKDIVARISEMGTVQRIQVKS